MQSSTTPPEASAPSWLPSLLKTAKLTEDAPLEQWQQQMDSLADSTAPVARSWWKWMVLIQGMSVLVPVLWLVRRTLLLPPATVALVTLGMVAVFTIALWWMRWRGMQRTWARARLTAEVARSQLSAAVCPELPARHVLDSIPALQPLLKIRQTSKQKDWPHWRDAWVADRLDGQLAYYRKAMDRAAKERQKFTRWSTLCMDVMLALSAAGVITTFSDRAPQWLRMLGDYRMELVLGLAGMLLPLGIILLQSLRSLQELNRRTARFARQIRMLEKAREKLTEAATPDTALQQIESIEEQLLGEVVDWYFEAETAEQFFQVRESKKAEAGHMQPAPASPLRSVSRLAFMVGGLGFFFIVRVALGRAPWVIGASAITLGWLSYSSPTDPEARSKLHVVGDLLDGEGRAWRPDPLRKANGCIIIAHGLHDGATLTAGGEESLWMRTMSQTLGQKLQDRLPNIGLVDWATAAAPTNIHRLDPKIGVGKFLGDLAGIPSQAREVGDFLAFRLAQMIWENKIDRNAPFHLIGHSAGGFVVSRAALQLHRMNLAPANMHVTILDTPAPDTELVGDVPNICPMDYYVTSPFVLGLNDDSPPARVHLKHIPPPAGSTALAAHSYAYHWFTQTITTAQPGGDGFGQSPFVEGARAKPATLH